MARPLRLEFPGVVYHVTSRGNAKQAIFLDKDDRESLRGGNKGNSLVPTLPHGYREVNLNCCTGPLEPLPYRQ